MQIDRLFRIVYILLQKKMVTAPELAREFEVSVRTIYRDVETLSGAGIPIYTIAGKGGGISLLDNFVLQKSAFSEEEQKQLIAALQNMDGAEHLEVNALLNKLGGIFRKEDTRWLEVDYSRWGTGGRDKEKFNRLKEAILKKYPIHFHYLDREGNASMRKIKPLKLIYKARNWYVQGYCTEREDYRTFKLNRMSQIMLEEEAFTEEFCDIPPLEEDGVPNSGPPRIVLRFHPSSLYRLQDEFAGEDIVRSEDGYYQVELDFNIDRWLYGYLLSFGSVMEVLEPQSLREDLHGEIIRMAANYDKR